MRFFRYSTFFILGVSLLVPWAMAQQASGLDAETGIRPFHSYDAGGVDSVNLSNGKLQVNIPLMSYAQRGGKLKLEYQLIYTNTGMYIPGCMPTAFSSGQCAIVWPFENGFFVSEVGRPGGGAGCGSEIVTDPFGSQILSYKCRASVIEPDGAGHPVAATGPSTFMALDGSGYRVDLAPGSLVSNPNHVAGVISDRYGNKYYQPFADSPGNGYIYAEDINGNQIWTSGGELTDTLGRVIPSVGAFPDSLPGPYPAGLGITDFSGCTGPLPITGATLWSPPGFDGGAYPIKFCFVEVPEVNPGGLQEFESCGPAPATCEQFDITMPALPTTGVQLQSVVLPNGSTWIFHYSNDGFGNLSQITFPTGGTISYVWTQMDQNGAIINSLPPFTRISPQGIVTRTFNANDGVSPPETWSYSYIRGTIDPGGIVNGDFVTTVTDPGLNDTVHTFAAFDRQGDPFETMTQTYKGSSASGQLLRTVRTEYKSFIVQSPNISSLNGDYQTLLPFRHTMTLDNGLQTKTEQDWDPGFLVDVSAYTANLVALPCGQIHQPVSGTPFSGDCFGSVPYGVIVEEREYDLASGAPGNLLRKTSTPRLALANGNVPYFINNLLELASSRTITDGAGNVVASTTFGYDETALAASGISVQHDPNPPVGTARGNLTSVSHVVTAPANSCNSAGSSVITASTQWYDTGQVYQQIDPLGNATSFTYSTAFAGAYPTQVCNALNQCATANYDFNWGLKTRSTDANNQSTNYQYDNLGRISQVTLPAQIVDGSASSGSTVFTYNDTPGSLSVQRTYQQDPATSLTDFQFFDGLGRLSRTKLVDPDGDVLTATMYDVFGRVSTVTNPYRSTSDPTYGVTQTQYDALGRVAQVIHPDGSAASITYIGRAVQMQDEGNGSSPVTHITQQDTLGRLASVCEVTNASQAGQGSPAACGQDIDGTGYLTTYQYDTLGNLLSVQQGSVARYFVYDSASRLLNATNPESGTTCYQYDANSNLVARIRAAPNQGNPQTTVSTTYQYDPLGRLTTTSYSDGITPTVSEHYDSSWELGVGLNNTIGRLSAEYVTSPSGQLLSGHVYSYDPMGRVVDHSQCTPQNCGAPALFPSQYTYDLLGKPLTFTNGQGVTFSYSYNQAGRLSTMTSSLTGAGYPETLFSGAQYSPFGGLQAGSLGKALTESLTYDNRGRLTAYSSAVQPIAQLTSPDIVGSSALAKLVNLNRTARPGPFLRRAVLRGLTPRRVVGSVVIAASDQRRGREHGSLKVQIIPTGLLQRSTIVTVPYRSRQMPVTIARRLANKINTAGGYNMRATVREQSSIAVVDLVQTAGNQSKLKIFVSLKSNHAVPSITATASAPGRNTPLLLGMAFSPDLQPKVR